MSRGRFIIGFALLVYLAADLWLLHGPLRKMIFEREPVAARVDGYPIFVSQLSRSIHEELSQHGKTEADLSPDELATIRRSHLDTLIDHTLLRLQVQAQQPPIAVIDAEIDARLQRFSRRFPSQAALQAAAKAEGVSNLRARLRSQIQQEKWIETHIATAIRVTDDEAQRWFSEHQAALAQPERIQARHCFLPTLDHPSDEARQTLETALATLKEGKKDFATLAKEISEDPATKEQGGGLGWMSRARLPADFSAPVFGLELNQPSLIRTKLGWHLIEVTGRKLAEPRTFDSAKPEILAALQAIKRRDAVTKLRNDLRAAATPQIEISPLP